MPLLRPHSKWIQGLRDCGRVFIAMYLVRILHPASRALQVLYNLLPIVLAKLREVFHFLYSFQTKLSQCLLCHFHLLGVCEKEDGLILSQSCPRACHRFRHGACLITTLGLIN